ncbi:MAG TPA: CGNR zinc finger domain-containing protein [Ktedonobacteraceae bacterium]|nr:CGNR zinc finger domain-containing protein [Ktedonobacteraceae bacterium]
MELLCLDFINSEFRDFRGRWVREELSRPEWLESFLKRWHLNIELPFDTLILDDLVALRKRLFHIVEGLVCGSEPLVEDIAVLNELLNRTSFFSQIVINEQNYYMVPTPIVRDWNWIQCEIISSFLSLLASYDRRRLKICANACCLYVFYDETKNRNQRFCNIDKCANLVKMRRFHARQKRMKVI